MTLFYAYLKDSVYDPYWRYIITFENREAADEWWRLVSTPPSAFAANIQRLAPQWFIQSADKGNIVNFFTDPSLVNGKDFLQKMFFTLLNDRDGRILSIAPPIKVTDHISGRWYFVRSRDDPHRHWHVQNGVVYVSTEHRTRFYIQVPNVPATAPKDFVIIGSDQITFTTDNDSVLRVNDAGQLVTTKSSQVPTPDTLFLFSDIRNRFITQETTDVNGQISEYVKVVVAGSGEVWELSN